MPRERQYSVDAKVVRTLTAEEIAAEEEITTMPSVDLNSKRTGSLPRIFENDEVPL